MPLANGTHLGPYEILEPLGAGGMGEVYRARDPRLRRDVALKLLPEAVARDPERLARLEREAQAVAALSHPNIVVIHSIESQGDLRFITMELVQGEPLSRSVESGGLPLERWLDLSIPLTEALAAAHERGVVHRDLKPANVMVTTEGRVKVLDFGLAKVVGPGPGATGATRTLDAPISVEGQVAGTAPYMAPEQLRGEPVDARTDLFSLGVILYELAAGRRPFAGATLATVGSAILRDAPASLGAIRPDLPPELDRIVARCLEKEPRRRFQTALEIRDGLRGLRRASQSAAPQADDAPSIAVLPFANMSADPENEYFSDGLSEELLNVLTKIPDLKVTGRTSSFAFKGRQEDLRQIGQKLGVSTLLEGSVRKAGNRVRITAQLVKSSDGFHLWSQTYDRVLDDIFAVQDDIAQSVSSALHVTLLGKPAAGSRGSAESFELVLRANHLFQQNTEPAMAQAVALYQEAIEKSPGAAGAWAGLAKAHAFQVGFGYTDPTETRRAALEEARRALSLDEHSAEAHAVMSLVLGYLEFRWKEAMAEAEKAMALAPGAGDPTIATALYLGLSGRMDEAVELARRAREIDPLNPKSHADYGKAAGWAGHLEAAREALLRALELSPRMTGVRGSIGILNWRMGLGGQVLPEILQEPAAGYRDYSLAIAHHLLGSRSESDAALARLHLLGDQWAYQFACAHAVRGEMDEGYRWLERAFELRDPGVATVRVDWPAGNLRADPRWPQFLKKTGLGDL
jgi:serine/threonine protein kinase